MVYRAWLAWDESMVASMRMSRCSSSEPRTWGQVPECIPTPLIVKLYTSNSITSSNCHPKAINNNTSINDHQDFADLVNFALHTYFFQINSIVLIEKTSLKSKSNTKCTCNLLEFSFTFFFSFRGGYVNLNLFRYSHPILFF